MAANPSGSNEHLQQVRAHARADRRIVRSGKEQPFGQRAHDADLFLLNDAKTLRSKQIQQYSPTETFIIHALIVSELLRHAVAWLHIVSGENMYSAETTQQAALKKYVPVRSIARIHAGSDFSPAVDAGRGG